MPPHIRQLLLSRSFRITYNWRKRGFLMRGFAIANLRKISE